VRSFNPINPHSVLRDHAALVAALQREHSTRLQPPAESKDWSDTLLQRWFEDGGYLSVEALSLEPMTTATRHLVDRVGEGLPVATLEPMDLRMRAEAPSEASTLLGALQSQDTDAASAALSRVANELVERGCAVCSLGLDTVTLQDLRSEGERAWPVMRPGELNAADGSTVAGRSPLGAARGDRFVLSSELLSAGGRLSDTASSWPALVAADDAIGRVGVALSPQLEGLGLPPLPKRSQSFLACFPGDGLGYGSHLDGSSSDGCTLQLVQTHAFGSARQPGRRCHLEMSPYSNIGALASLCSPHSRPRLSPL
jgi:hypothetical protein